MNQKFFGRLIGIFVAILVFIVNVNLPQALAVVSNVNITSPTATNKVYVKAGGTVSVSFTIDGEEGGYRKLHCNNWHNRDPYRN